MTLTARANPAPCEYDTGPQRRRLVDGVKVEIHGKAKYEHTLAYYNVTIIHRAEES